MTDAKGRHMRLGGDPPKVGTRFCQGYKPMLERMALVLDANDPLTARGDDLRRLAVLYGVPTDGEEEDVRAGLLARWSGAWEKR